MQVIIGCPQKPSEWLIIEVQGSLDCKAESLAGIELGTLVIQGSTDAPDTPLLLSIGSHILDGKVVKLKKPLCVLQKQDGSLVTGGSDALNTINYRVAGTVRRKYLFKNRPKPQSHNV